MFHSSKLVEFDVPQPEKNEIKILKILSNSIRLKICIHTSSFRILTGETFGILAQLPKKGIKIL